MKKLISLLLVMTVMLGCTVVSINAEEEKTSVLTNEEIEADDLAKTNEMVDTVFGLGIMERDSDELMNLSGKATRIDTVIWL